MGTVRLPNILVLTIDDFFPAQMRRKMDAEEKKFDLYRDTLPFLALPFDKARRAAPLLAAPHPDTCQLARPCEGAAPFETVRVATPPRRVCVRV